MAREEAEAGERRGDERLLRLLLGPGGCLLSSSFLFFFFCAPLARPAAAEVPEPRPQGGGQALDVKGGVGVDQEDGLAAGQGGGRGLGEVLHTQRERETETEKRLSFFVVCSCVCVWGGGRVEINALPPTTNRRVIIIISRALHPHLDQQCRLPAARGTHKLHGLPRA